MLERDTVFLLPIVSCDPSDTASLWPEWGPDLNALREWVSAFFGLNAIVLDPSTVSLTLESHAKESNEGKIFSLSTPSQTRPKGMAIKGRHHIPTGHSQMYMDDCASYLKTIFSSRKYVVEEDVSSAAVIIGVTCEDLYCEGTDSLFTAGMVHTFTVFISLFFSFFVCFLIPYSRSLIYFYTTANIQAYVRDKVSILSFARYHPQIRMSGMDWFDYGYTNAGTDSPYYQSKVRAKAKNPKEVNAAISESWKREFFRRTGKLVVHEVCHLFFMDHCTYYHCLMNGTGHLLEDYNGPTQECPVCLRKLQLRFGFDVRQRYRSLLAVYTKNGLAKEATWIAKRLKAIEEVVDIVGERTEGGSKSKKYVETFSSKRQRVIDLSKDD
jgi:predicted Zn-dependent protease